MNELDTEATEVEQQTDTAEPAAQSQDNQDQAPQSTEATAQTQATETEKTVPFAAGKEKFKVNGQEVEWDWDTAKRYAQMGYASHQKWEQAASVEKKAKETFSQMVHAAQTDPVGLIKLLNPGFTGFDNATQKGADGETQTEANPLEHKLTALERKLAQYEEGLERQAVAEERKLIEGELEAAVKSYPVLNNKIFKDYVKSQYANALRKGMDVSLDDVAFHVANEVKMQRAEEEKSKMTRIEENRKKAPVGSVPGAAGTAKPMTREDVMRLAGYTV